MRPGLPRRAAARVRLAGRERSVVAAMTPGAAGWRACCATGRWAQVPSAGERDRAVFSQPRGGQGGAG